VVNHTQRAQCSIPCTSGKRYALKHGVHALTKLVKTLGTDRAIDKRTGAGKALVRWRQDLIADLGGDVSTQQDAIISLAIKTRLLLDSIDVWLLQQPTLIIKKKAIIPSGHFLTCSSSLSRIATGVSLSAALIFSLQSAQIK
jgi:hypothetical protein